MMLATKSCLVSTDVRTAMINSHEWNESCHLYVCARECAKFDLIERACFQLHCVTAFYRFVLCSMKACSDLPSRCISDQAIHRLNFEYIFSCSTPLSLLFFQLRIRQVFNRAACWMLIRNCKTLYVYTYIGQRKKEKVMVKQHNYP